MKATLFQTLQARLLYLIDQEKAAQNAFEAGEGSEFGHIKWQHRQVEIAETAELARNNELLTDDELAQLHRLAHR